MYNPWQKITSHSLILLTTIPQSAGNFSNVQISRVHTVRLPVIVSQRKSNTKRHRTTEYFQKRGTHSVAIVGEHACVQATNANRSARHQCHRRKNVKHNRM